MPYGIQNSKFFLAVKDFEAKNFQAAFDKMLECANDGNFYALYYLEYLLKHKIKNAIKLTPEQDKRANELCDQIQYVPKHGKPATWLHASCIIIEMADLRKRKKPLNKQVKLLCEFTPTAPNAMVYLLEHLDSMHAEDKKLKKNKFTVSANLYLIAYSNEHPNILAHRCLEKEYLNAIGLNKKYLKIEQHANSKEIQKDGDLEFILGKEFNERSWIIDAAYMGNQQAQAELTTLTYPFPLVISSKEESESYEWLQLRARDHLNASIAVALKQSLQSGGNLKEKKLVQEALETALVQKEEEALKTTPKEYLREAYYILGFMYANEETFPQARSFFEKAIKFESSSAHAMLGRMHQHGYGVPQNFKLAADHYEQSLILEETISKQAIICNIAVTFSVTESLANIYLEGDDSLKADEVKGFNVLKKGSLTEKKPQYKVNCQIRCAFLQYFGIGVDSDKKAAVEELEQLYLKGEEGAALVIAQVYFRAHAEKVELPAFTPAILQKSLNIAAKKNPVTFCIDVTAAKFERSVHLNLIKIAAELGYARAAHYYGLEMANDLLVDKAPSRENKKFLKECERFLQFAYQHKFEGSASSLGIYYYNVLDTKRALQYIKEGLQKNEWGAIREMADAYEEGNELLGIEEDKEQAFQLYSELANTEDPEQVLHGLFHKARLLKSGFGKTKPDVVAAVPIFEDLLKKDFLLAGIELADIYDRGLEGNPRDPKRVFEYLKIAEPTEDANVLNALGFCYRYAQGTEPDIKNAMEYFEKAAKKGHHNACKNYVTIKLKENMREIRKEPARFKRELEEWRKLLEEPRKLFGDGNLMVAVISLIEDPKSIKSVVQKLRAGHHCKHSRILQKWLMQDPEINLEILEQIIIKGVETLVLKKNETPAGKSTIDRLEELGEELFSEKPAQLDLRKVNRYVGLLQNLLSSEDDEDKLEINARRRKGIFTAFQIHGQQHSFTWHPMHGKGRRNSLLQEPGPISHILRPLAEVHNQVIASKKGSAAASQ